MYRRVISTRNSFHGFTMVDDGKLASQTKQEHTRERERAGGYREGGRNGLWEEKSSIPCLTVIGPQ